MAETKLNRNKKKQLGQFMTPIEKCEEIINRLTFSVNDKILEPSFGCGNFIITIIDKLLPLYDGTTEEKLDKILTNNIYGVELDKELFNKTLENIKEKYGYLPDEHNLVRYDYLIHEYDFDFDYIIGNPPFGGTINPKFDKELEKKFGTRDKMKIKKETYSFFMIKSIENLKENGKLVFISSDTFLTIKTMKGLRKFLFKNGYNQLFTIEHFSEETDYPMVILSHHKSNNTDHILIDGTKMFEEDMLLTDNFSWHIPKEYVKYFKGEKLKKYIIGSGGMTVGKNEYFLRKIREDNTIEEPYNFTFFDDPITLEKELSKARLNKLGVKKTNEVKEQEANGETKRNVKIELKETPEVIQLPNDDYCFYNKANNKILYNKPTDVIFWKDDGDACITFKKNGNWYLHGVGGKPYFKMEGITWQLISMSIKAKYLPAGYILDSGAPIAVLQEGVAYRELFFILGWLLTNKATEILKNVINHTKNIQSKDIERLPYPFWVNEDNKKVAIDYIKKNIKVLHKGGELPSDFIDTINDLYKV